MDALCECGVAELLTGWDTHRISTYPSQRASSKAGNASSLRRPPPKLSLGSSGAPQAE